MSPFVPPPGYDPVRDSSYHYVPTESVAIIFVTLFGLSTLLHLIQAIHFRMWWLLPTAVLAGVGEIIGWSGRLWSSLDDGFLNTPFLIQISTTIISPTPLLAVYFILLGRIIPIVGQQYSRIGPKLYIIIFTTSDIVALVVQAVGGGTASGATTDSGSQLGGHIALAGIVFQFFSLICYITLGTEFFLRFHHNRPIRFKEDAVELERRAIPPQNTARTRTTKSGQKFTEVSMRVLPPKHRFGHLSDKLRFLLYGMAFSILCLFIRAIYRTVELADGWNGRIISTQVYFNVLDGMMVLLATWTLNILHPGYLFPFTKDVNQ